MAELHWHNLVTTEEYARFSNPTGHWIGFASADRKGVTREWGRILRRQYEAGACVADMAQKWGKLPGVIRHALKSAGVSLDRTRRSSLPFNSPTKASAAVYGQVREKQIADQCAEARRTTPLSTLCGEVGR